MDKNRFLRKKQTSKLRRNISLGLLSLPALVWVIIFCYIPMYGVVVAFRDYSFSTGMFGGDWVGFKYFNYFFASVDSGRIIRNTVLYNLAFLILTQVLSLLVALLLYELSKRAVKVYQTAIIIPNFVSWVLVAYIGFSLFSDEHGMINALLENMHLDTVRWYSEPKYWPYILTVFNIWKNVGMGSIIYYASLLSIDASLFEAAQMDGANRFKQIMKISVPSVLPIFCLMLIINVGSIMAGDFGLFYQLPMNSGALYPTTDVISTFVYRGLQSSNISLSAAVGLFQNVVGVVLLVTTNLIVKKINPDYALY